MENVKGTQCMICVSEKTLIVTESCRRRLNVAERLFLLHSLGVSHRGKQRKEVAFNRLMSMFHVISLWQRWLGAPLFLPPRSPIWVWLAVNTQRQPADCRPRSCRPAGGSSRDGLPSSGIDLSNAKLPFSSFLPLFLAPPGKLARPSGRWGAGSGGEEGFQKDCYGLSSF